MRTFSPTPADIDPQWHIIDADGMVLGRLATRIATVLRGKHKPTFAPHMDMGDFVVVINASKIRLTGNKGRDKWTWTHSGFPGGIKGQPIGNVLENNPEKLLEDAVKGMLPKNTIGRKQLRKMKVYAGSEHPHGAQNPQPLAV
ncbi:50S ribosomal protein L13 [Euzebya tangerina]|uniref:50S ribosomal protein L13 n=1 Tax=Euzebya tangerina TaxID=591198 RepID=UPI000E317A4A|nr:50S ribosomal protein L13 [Euzebya tangerina]